MYPTHFHPLAARKHAARRAQLIRFWLAALALVLSAVAFVAAYGVPLVNVLVTK